MVHIEDTSYRRTEEHNPLWDDVIFSDASSGSYNEQNWAKFLSDANYRITHKSDRNIRDDVYVEYQKKFLSSFRAYAQNNSNVLNLAHQCYEAAISQEFIDSYYDLREDYELTKLLAQCKVLIITANPIERAILHYYIIRRKKSDKIIRIIKGNVVYFIFKWNSYWIVHILQPQTGSYTDLGLHNTATEVLTHFRPNVILSIGVAFGIDYETQNIGDVLVSNRILPYGENKRSEETLKPDRSQDKVIDNWLNIRFINTPGFLDGITYGSILSGGSVMSSFHEKDVICTAYSKNDYIIGGEMEGIGLFQISRSYGIPCAVIKGICDWGVAKNDIYPNDPSKESDLKHSLQAYAMFSVMRKCDILFKDKTIFSVSKTEPLEDEIEKNKKLTINNILISIQLLLLVFIGLLSSSQDLAYQIVLVSLIIVALLNLLLTYLIAKRKKRITDNYIIDFTHRRTR